MRKSYRFPEVTEFAECELSDGDKIRVPVVTGIFKHATADMLRELLKKPAVAKKYTVESLRVAPWPVMRKFPRSWLMRHLEEADLRPTRKAAILFMLNTSAADEE
ncbi:hypothetical protein [Desulfonema magnum]|uniref:Uncharacterized protein n=1 Tax=Desulfonema magnum TaxID=45655 RepID=A0A975BG67_9BACT|nr:hypothetical protein [Desulfonema magnum]QTA84771.1 Uncharacterized protein dnm_007710 [Desulfonema magnum]